MNEAIIVALITAVASVLGSYFIYKKGHNDDEIKEAQREQRQADRLESIEHKLDIHNGYAEKLGEISKSIVAMQKDIEYLKESKNDTGER